MNILTVLPNHLIDPELKSGEFHCPECGIKSSIKKNSDYQMNDIFEEAFCSYDCSMNFNMKHKESILKAGYSAEDLEEMA